MFISAKHPRAERITPSVGDGGIDVLVRGDKTSVYQVKKFAASLTPKQKKQVEKSLDRLASDPRTKDLKVDEWHLVMPWDPTLEEKKWLRDYVMSKGFPEPHWDGLTRCDLWASEYPHIVDYYLGGNAERIQQMALSIVHGLRLKEIRSEDVEKWDMSAFAHDLEATARILDREDPFYSYGVHIEPASSVPVEDRLRNELLRPRPGIVCSTVWGDSSVQVQVDVYPKNAVARELSPLTFNMNLTAKIGSPEAGAIEDFFKFGTPLELPEGSVSGVAHLPAGLGGDFANAAITVLPNATISDQDRELRLVLVDENNVQVDSLMLERKYTSSGVSTEQGPRGLEALFTDSLGIVKVRLRFDANEKTQSMKLDVDVPDGSKLAVGCLPVLSFYRRMHAPNSLALAPRFGPLPKSRYALEDSQERTPRFADLWHDVALGLSLIQEHTSESLFMPKPSELDDALVGQILKTGALLNGQTLTFKMDFVSTEHDPDVKGDAETITMLVPWSIELPGTTVDLGYLAHAFSGTFYERAHEGTDGLYDVWRVSEGKVLARMLTPEEQKAVAN
uniref:hypothetical protein n=1 Tax=Paenarthrobacter ureafaciens TaxID=37931 RepID=UPI003F4982CB